MKTEKDVIAFREFNIRVNIFKSRNLERNGALLKRKFNVPVRMQIYNLLEFLSLSFSLSLSIYILFKRNNSCGNKTRHDPRKLGKTTAYRVFFAYSESTGRRVPPTTEGNKI